MAAYQSTSSPDPFAVSPATNVAIGFAILALAGILVSTLAIMRLPSFTSGIVAGPAILVAVAASAWRERQMFGR